MKKKNKDTAVAVSQKPDTTGVSSEQEVVPHVTRDKKGRIVSGSPSLNPQGRPAGTTSFTDMLRRVVQKQHEKTGKPILEVLADNLAFLGTDQFDRGAIQDIANRLDGTPRQTVDITAQQNVRYDKSVYQATASMLFEHEDAATAAAGITPPPAPETPASEPAVAPTHVPVQTPVPVDTDLFDEDDHAQAD